MRGPAWAAAWWQRRRAEAERRRLRRRSPWLTPEQLARAVDVEIGRPGGGPRVRVQLVGGPRDGQPYDVPQAYPGADALPDAIATHDRGRIDLYHREGRTLRYRHEEQPR